MYINEVISILSECTGCEKTEITPDKHIIYDLFADSMALLEIAARVEERFHFNFDEEMLDQINSVYSLYILIKKHGSFSD